jgi:methionyl-tRNA synthetase
VFHALIWPAMLMAYSGYVLPSVIPANQFLTLEGEKLSTSKGHAIWLPEYLKEFPPDSLRYALTRNSPEVRDADFTWRDFQSWHNNELADILGNFVNRTLTFIHKYYSGSVPTASAFTEHDNQILNLLHSAPDVIGNKIEHFEFKNALQEVMKIAQEANRYFDYEEPWVTRKTNPLICERTMYVCMKIVTSLAVLSEPFLPFTADKIKEMIRFIPQKWDDIGTPDVAPSISRPQILFEKFDDKVIELQISKLKKREVTADELQKIVMKTATILSAERIEHTNNLIKCVIEIGDVKRQIVAGIGTHYTPEALVGKTIVVVENLKPARIKGVVSEGMLLAADGKEGIILLTTDKPVTSGTVIR